MRRAIPCLCAEADLPRAIVEAEVGTALSVGAVDEAAHVEGTPSASHYEVLFGRFEDGLEINLGAGDTVLIVVDRAERKVDRMKAVQHPPARHITFDDYSVAIAKIASRGDEEMRSWPEVEIEAGLGAAEVETRPMTPARREWRRESFAKPELIAS